MRLAMPRPLHIRLYGGCGGGERVGDRAEAVAAVVQLCRSPWVSGSWTSLCSSATSSCSPRRLIRMRLRFTFVQQRPVRTVQPVQKTGDFTVLVQFWGAVDMTGAGVQPVQAALEFHSCSALAVGAAAWGEEGGV